MVPSWVCWGDVTAQVVVHGAAWYGHRATGLLDVVGRCARHDVVLVVVEIGLLVVRSRAIHDWFFRMILDGLECNFDIVVQICCWTDKHLTQISDIYTPTDLTISTAIVADLALHQPAKITRPCRPRRVPSMRYMRLPSYCTCVAYANVQPQEPRTL